MYGEGSAEEEERAGHIHAHIYYHYTWPQIKKRRKALAKNCLRYVKAIHTHAQNHHTSPPLPRSRAFSIPLSSLTLESLPGPSIIHVAVLRRSKLHTGERERGATKSGRGREGSEKLAFISELSIRPFCPHAFVRCIQTWSPFFPAFVG